MPLPYPDPTPEDAVSGRRPDGRFSVSRNQQEVFARKLGRGRGPSALIQKTPCCLGIQRLVGAVIALKRRQHRGGIEYKIRMLRSAARIIVFSRCRDLPLQVVCRLHCVTACMSLAYLGQVEVLAGLDVLAVPDGGALGNLLLPLRRPRLVGQPAGCQCEENKQAYPSSHAGSVPLKADHNASSGRKRHNAAVRTRAFEFLRPSPSPSGSPREPRLR